MPNLPKVTFKHFRVLEQIQEEDGITSTPYEIEILELYNYVTRIKGRWKITWAGRTALWQSSL